jgi:hypothetical protein
MDPLEGNYVFDRTEVRSTIGNVEVTFRQTHSDTANIVGYVKLELTTHGGSVEGRKHRAADWRVEDLMREVAIWVDSLDSRWMSVSKLMVMNRLGRR